MKQSRDHGWLLFLLLIIFLVAVLSYLNIVEPFANDNAENLGNELTKFDNEEPKGPYLFPTRKLQGECEKEGLKPAFMPKTCFVDGTLNEYSNCKCEDENGNCKICYGEIKKDTKNANVVYNANFE